MEQDGAKPRQKSVVENREKQNFKIIRVEN